MCNCCGPLYELVKMYTVRAVTVTPTLITLTVNRLFADLPQNAQFRLCIPHGVLPRNNTGVIMITDGVITLEVRGWQGNYLRADSLRQYVCKHTRRLCSTVVLSAYRGNDPAHVTIHNRMCASSVGTAEVAPGDASTFAAAPAATKKAATPAKE